MKEQKEGDRREGPTLTGGDITEVVMVGKGAGVHQAL